MRRVDDHSPNYHINVSFQCEELSLDELDAFVEAIQAKLTENGHGELLMYGIDEDQKNGDFLIYCNYPNRIKLTYDLIRPIVESCVFFQNGWYSLLLPTKTGGYIMEGWIIRESIPITGEYDELEPPIPEGFEEQEKGGCMPALTVIVVLVVSIIALL